VEPLVNQFTYL